MDTATPSVSSPSAEADIIAHLTSRYFGLRAFGGIYGYAFATYVLAGALGPWLMGPGLMTVRS